MDVEIISGEEKVRLKKKKNRVSFLVGAQITQYLPREVLFFVFKLE